MGYTRNRIFKKRENNIENHLNKIKSIIKNNFEIPNEQINCLWYCVNGNKLEDEDKSYINSLLNIYKEKYLERINSIAENYIFPIIFVYTQAFSWEQDKIDLMKNTLKNIDFFKSKDLKEIEEIKENTESKNSKELKVSKDSDYFYDFLNLKSSIDSKNFHFIEVIAKEKEYLNRRTKKKELEPKYNINKLIDLSLKLGKKGMSLPLLLNANELFKEMYDKGKELTENLIPIIIELMKTILGSEKTRKEDIFNEAIPLFKKLIKNLSQEKIDKESEKIINGFIDDIITIMKNIMENQLNIAIHYFNKKDYINSFKSLLSQKYKEKNNNNLKESYFNDACLDFIISPISDNIQKYGVFFYLII